MENPLCKNRTQILNTSCDERSRITQHLVLFLKHLELYPILQTATRKTLRERADQRHAVDRRMKQRGRSDIAALHKGSENIGRQDNK